MPINNDYDHLFQSAGQAWNVDPLLLKALTSQESAGNTGARSKAGAYGLTQIMPDTAKYLGITDPTDPQQQIYGAAKYLSEALDREDSPESALSYYHGGPDWRRNFGPESAGYAPAITQKYLALKAAQPKPAPDAAPSKDDSKPPGADDPFGQALAAARAQSAPPPDPTTNPFEAALHSAKVATAGQLVVSEDPFGDAVKQARAANMPPAPAPVVPAMTMGSEAPIPGAAGIPDASIAVPAAAVASVAGAAGSAAADAFGTAPLGLSPEHEQWLMDHGVFNEPGGYNPLKALNRGIIGGGAAAGDLLARGMGAVFRGGQAAVAEAGNQVGAPQLGRDIAALPEAFAGDAATQVGGMRPPEVAAAPVVAGAMPQVSQFARTGANTLTDAIPMAPRVAVNDVALNPLARVPEAANAPAFVPPGSRIPEPAPPPVNVGARPSFIPPENPLSPPTVQESVGNALSAVPMAPTEIEVNAAKEAARAANRPTPANGNTPGASRPPTAAPVEPAPTAAPVAPLTVPGRTVPSLAEVPDAVTKANFAPKAETASAVDAPSAEPGAVSGVPDRNAQVQRIAAEHAAVHAPAITGGDETNYVPGVRLTKADVTGDAEHATDLKRLGTTPEGMNPVRALQENNTIARHNLFDDVAKTGPDTDALIQARSDQAGENLQAAFGNKVSTDAKPVVDTLQGILTNARDSENTAVQQYIRPLLGRMFDQDGILKSDPERLYGLREDVARMQGKAAKAETPTLDHVTGQLQQVKEALDGVIEAGAPGYRKYLKDFSDASRPIDQQEFLQGYKGKLTNGSDRDFSFPKVDAMMKNIVKMRGAKGVNQAKSISPEAMDRLIALHSDLKREHHTNGLAGVKGGGSHTDMMQQVGAKLGVGAARMLAASHTGFLSEVGIHVASDAMKARKVRKMLENHLNPDVGKLVKARDAKGRNPLLPPLP